LTNVLFNLATHTSYVEPLREEISKIIQEEGWNKISLEKMRKLDSFIKESQRVYGSAAAMVNRVVLSDFTFSDGTVVPKWADVAVAVRAINQDEASDSSDFDVNKLY
jgi:cytochrome P450